MAKGLWIIDQHVAHERVLFEQHLQARREGELGGQRMLMPLIVELNPRQLVTFEQIAEELRANGFEAELMGGAQRGDSGRARGNRQRATRKSCCAKFWTASRARTRPFRSIRCNRKSPLRLPATRRSK